MRSKPIHGLTDRGGGLTKSLGLKLFALAFIFSGSAFLIWIVGGNQSPTLRLYFVVFIIPVLCLFITPTYMWVLANDTLGWQNQISLIIFRFIFWLGTFWQLLCGLYFLIEWGLGRGLLIWFPS